jgi:hypothetical protein
MKKVIILCCLCLIAALNYQCKKDSGGDDPGDNPPAAGNFDKITGKIGYERVEIDLIKAGRVPAGKLNFGTATKTVIEYDGTQTVIDSLCSWVNVTGLTQSKDYTFKIYAMDAAGTNKLAAKEISLKPYTSAELEKDVVLAQPKTVVFASSAVLSWPYGVSTAFAEYYGLSYSYTDKHSATRTGTATGDYPQFILTDLGTETTVKIKYKIIPKRDYIAIIDTVFLDNDVPLTGTAGSDPFEPAEAAILTANGITTFTPDAVANIETLYYPPHARSLDDIVYFSGLKTLDLTGGSAPSLPSLIYPCAWFDPNVSDTVGRGPWLPFMKRMDIGTSGVPDNPVGGVAILQSLLENDLLEKVRYIPNSMGMDEALAPFVASGKVELVTLPDESPITNNFCFGNLAHYLSFLDWMTVTPDPVDPPAGAGATNILKGTIHGIHGAVAISTPFEYKFNIQAYPYLKFKVYVPALSDAYKDLKNINVVFLNMLSTNYANTIYPGNSREEFFAPQVTVTEGAWTEVSIDAASVITNAYTYVALIRFGSGATTAAGTVHPYDKLLPSDQDGVYVAGLRFSKTP